MSSQTVMLIQEDVEGGGKEEDMNGMEHSFAYNNNVYNAQINIRMAFLRKVYGLLSVQLLLTVAVVTVFIACEPIKLFVQQNSWMLLLSFVMTMGILVGLLFKRKDHPVNLILLSIFTIVQAYTVATVVTMYETHIVLEALFITLTVLVGLTAYTFQSKQDFSFLGSGLFIGLWILILGGLLQMVLQSDALEVLFTIGGAALFCLFIVYDTHLIMHKLSPEEYILATINLYLDIINLFLYILRFVAAANK